MVAALAVCGAFPAAASAAPGQIDATFGQLGNGIVINPNGQFHFLSKVLRQADGKLVVISTSLDNDPSGNITVRRYLGNARPDPAFHQTDVPGAGAIDVSVGGALQPDGKIIVAGDGPQLTGFFVVRLRADGGIDPTFTTPQPTMTYGSSTEDTAPAVGVGPGGTIVVAGQSGPVAGVARFTSTGAFDNTFSGDGRATFDFGDSSTIRDLAVLPDGRIVIVGNAPRPLVARINANGALDTSFGVGGRVDPTHATFGVARSVVIQGTKLVVAGHLAISRYNANGTIDPSFGSGGTARPSPRYSSDIEAFVADASGRLVAVGGAAVSSRSTLTLAVFRFTPDGVPDAAFGCAGSVLTQVLGNGDGLAFGESVAIAATGDGNNIVVGGIGAAFDPIAGLDESDFLARFAGDGAHTSGYGLLRGDGGTSAFGGTPACGSASQLTLKAPAVGVAYDPVAPGNWTVTSEGAVFTFGVARFFGPTRAIHLKQPIVGMAAAPDGKGYWLVARDGGIFAFGSARFVGSTGAIHLNQPIVGMAAARDGQGYWLVARDGGIFAFGSAKFVGSTGSLRLNQPVVGMAADPDGTGYWLVASDGGVFAFSAKFSGSTGAIHLNQPIVGIAADPDGTGYWMAARDGGVFAFAAQYNGSTAATPFPLGSPQSTVGIAATP
jgi:uncharacterized delta-60 repeat protein